MRPGQVQRFDPAGLGAAHLVLVQPDFLIPGTTAARIAADRFAPSDTPRARFPSGPGGRAARAAHRVRGSAERRRAPDAVRTDTLRHLQSVLILGLAGAPRQRQRQETALMWDSAICSNGTSPRRTTSITTRAPSATRRGLSPGRHTRRRSHPLADDRERLALEAARLLAHSNRSIMSTAFELGFRDPPNFSTFFAGPHERNPTQFRAAQRP